MNTSTKVEIQTKSGSYAIECAPDEKILFAALRNGVSLPYECSTGTCGTCKARVAEGDVEAGWPDAPGRSYLKPKRNEILMCQATTRGSPCVLRVASKIGDTKNPIPDHWKGTISGLERLTHDVLAFSVEIDGDMDFEAGQFVVMGADEVEGGRAYSMTNYARGTSQIDFVVKRKPDGKFSDWLFDSADLSGRSVELFGPLGRATFHPEEDRNVVCIGGGSGIAGLMSILSRACQEQYFARRRGQVFFGVRTPGDVFFLDALAGYASAFPDLLRITVALSDEAPTRELEERHAGLNFTTGFVHTVAAQAMAGRCEETLAYVAGPPPMVDGALRALIMDADLPASAIRYDKFG